MDDADYIEQDGLGLAQLVVAGEVTPTELLEAAQRRAAALNPRVNAIVRPMDAEAQARLAEPLQGPFGGVPFLIKDLGQEYAGLPSTAGSRAFVKDVPAEHSTVVRRWLDAGLVIFGKTNTPELGAKGVTEPVLFGPARNPFALDRTPGGSSGGAAAAVAAGIVPVAGASDGGGSIRIPAGCCGLFGLKPGRGLVPFGPVSGERLQGAAANGVVSRTVRDTAAMLDVLAGPDATSPYAPAVPHGPFLEEVGREPARLRIGFCNTSSINPTPDPAAVAAVADAAMVCTELGHEVQEVPQPVDDAALSRDVLPTWFVYVAAAVADARRRFGAADGDFEPDTLAMAALGRATSSVALSDAIDRRHEYIRALARFHDSHDLLLTPTLARAPIRVGELDTPAVLQRAVEALTRTRTSRVLAHVGLTDDLVRRSLGWVPYTQLGNITGRPAMSVPLHWTSDGLPLGVQFVGRLGSEGLLLQLAAQLERARPWVGRFPALAMP
jgi:Asp-tRNA(Asn)/Glu-tRNA(Gln) amidotransferase A subunit family amidase